MEVNSVAIVVIQKLTDMLTEEKSMIGQKAILDQLNDIKKDLEKLRGVFIDATRAAKYLDILYNVEDAIETFALRISLQRKRLGFLMNHALFLKNFTAYKKLKRKIGKIKKEIMDLQDKKPNESQVQDASLPSTIPTSPDIYQQSSTDGINVSVLPAETVRNVHTDSHKSLNRDASISSECMKYSRRSKSLSYKAEDLGIVGNVHTDSHKSLNRDASIISERMKYSRRSTSLSYKAEDLGIVGFDAHIKELVHELTQGVHQIIPVMGEKGSGKTTLARAILATKRAKYYFKSSFAWVTIDKDTTADEILLNLLKQVDSSKDQDYIHPKDPQSELRKRLNEHKFLIVLDNLGETVTWGKIEDAFRHIKDGTKIIITTRELDVAKSANKRYNLNLQRLTDKDALDLFKQKANWAYPEDLNPDILKICDGVPLNVVLLGSLLSTKKPSNWIDSLNRQTSDVLTLSYDDLSDGEKLCLLYMVLFPKEYDIPVRRLLRLWLAEGFIKQPDSSGNKNLSEDLVNECFEKLFKRSLILITNMRSDGGQRKCRLPGDLHEYLFKKAIDIKLFHVHKNEDCHTDEGSRRLVEFVDRKNCSFSKSWRSYLSFNFQKKDTPAREVGVLLSKMLKSGFSLLTVLDLEGVYKPSLPDNLGNFFLLRYLGLRWTFLDHLPSSVGDLTHLETLDLKHTNVSSLPVSVWKLNHLRHLNLNDIRLDMPVNSNYSFLGLLTLCGLSIIDGDRVKDGLDRLLHLRELDLTFQLEDCKDLIDWVSNLTSLEQLRLRSKDVEGGAATLSLNSLSSLEKLSHMNLLGKLPTLLELNQFPQNLKVLTISVSKLEIDPMETLGKLEHLTVLRLLAKSYLGKEIKCHAEGFKELRVLKLWMLTELKVWKLEDKCMEKLNELSIRRCLKLESVPEKLFKQPSFKELILNNMPKKFQEKVADAIASHEKGHDAIESHVSVIVKDYEFTPLPWEEEEWKREEEEEDDVSEVTNSEDVNIG